MDTTSDILTPYSHAKLVDLAYKWVLKKTQCGMAFKEFYTAACNGEYPDVIGFAGWGYSVLVEAKASRADFLRDKKKMFRKNPEQGMGLYRFYICPTGLIRVEDLPEKWGLLYVNEKGRVIVVHNPYSPNGGNIWANGCERNIRAEHGMMYSALRRLHIKGHLDSIYDKQYVYDHRD
jgi:hypothetical protein